MVDFLLFICQEMEYFIQATWNASNTQLIKKLKITVIHFGIFGYVYALKTSISAAHNFERM